MRALLCLIGLFLAATTTLASAQDAGPDTAKDWPSQPVRIVVGFTAGGSADVLARAMAIQLGVELKQSFYIENQAGANGTIAIANAVRAAPNGYTLFYGSGSIATVPHMYPNTRFDIMKDLVPVATIGVLDGYLMVVHPDFPAKTVPEFIAHAKTNRVIYGSPGVGNTLHLAAEVFKVKAGIEMDHVPFKSTNEVSLALLQKQIQTTFTTPPSTLDLLESKQLRAIALTASKPYPELPDVPLMSTVLPSYPITRSWGIVFAPTGTPPAIVTKLNAAIRATLRVPAVANIVQRAGYQPDERTPEQTATFFRGEVDIAGETVRVSGVKGN